MMNKTFNILMLVLEVILMFGLFVVGIIIICSDNTGIPVKLFVMFFIPVWIMMFGWISDINDRIIR